MPNVIHDRRLTEPGPPAGAGYQLDRQQAIKQIERRRKFKVELAVSAVAMVVLIAIWAISEFQNAGGWPTDGFSQSSSIPHVWNMWIVYPILGWALIMSARGWDVYLHKAISEDEIRREIERQGLGRR